MKAAGEFPTEDGGEEAEGAGSAGALGRAAEGAGASFGGGDEGGAVGVGSVGESLVEIRASATGARAVLGREELALAEFVREIGGGPGGGAAAATETAGEV